MKRLFKASAFLLLSLAATGCQSKEPTLEERIYDVYSKGGYFGSRSGSYNWHLTYKTYYTIYLAKDSSPENLTFDIEASYTRRQTPEDEVKRLYNYEAVVSFQYRYGETVTQNGKHSEDFESGKTLIADYENHYKSTFDADVETDGTLTNINITSCENDTLSNEEAAKNCKEEIQGLFAEFPSSDYADWCEENNVANIFDPIGNAANSSESIA